MSTTLTNAIEAVMNDAKLVAYDGCHKIYVALDDTEAKWFFDNEYDTFQGTPEEILSKVSEWYDDSCSLRFVEATSWDKDNQSTDFRVLVSQFEESEEL